MSGFKPGIMRSKKPTAKQLAGRADGTEKALNQLFVMLSQEIGKLKSEVTSLRQLADKANVRSMATMNLLVGKSFTSAEHEVAAESVNIEIFEDASAADDKERGLVETTDPVSAGTFFTAQIEATDSVTGERLPQLSVLRMKLEFEDKAYPKEIVDLFTGMVPGLPKTSPVLCSATLRGFEGKTVNFTVNVFKVLRAPVVSPVTDVSPLVAEIEPAVQ